MSVKAGVKLEFKGAKLGDIMSKWNDLSGTSVEVGYHSKETNIIALSNNFGTSTIPARPYLDRAVRGLKSFSSRRERGRFRQRTAALLGRKDAVKRLSLQMMESAGERTLFAVREELDTSPAWAVQNAPSTVDKKGHHTQLLDHKDRLHTELRYVVRRKRKVVARGS